MGRLSGLRIGAGAWRESLDACGRDIHPDFWSGFVTASPQEIKECENALRRTLPEDFKVFLRGIGYGKFPRHIGGGIDSLEDIVMECVGPIWMTVHGANKIPDNELHTFYVSRGAINPAPHLLKPTSLVVCGVNVLDMVQIGTNGMCCYHQLVLDPHRYGFGYCLLTPEATLEDRRGDFSAALVTILSNM